MERKEKGEIPINPSFTIENEKVENKQKRVTGTRFNTGVKVAHTF